MPISHIKFLFTKDSHFNSIYLGVLFKANIFLRLNLTWSLLDLIILYFDSRLLVCILDIPAIPMTNLVCF